MTRMRKTRLIGMITAILVPMTLAAQLPESRYTFKLHGQTRKYLIAMTDRNDTVDVAWSIARDGALQKGIMRMPRNRVENGNAFCWQQPADGERRVLGEGETFGIISRQAFSDLKDKGFFVYNGVTYRKADEEGGRVHVRADIDETQMWIEMSGELPVISEMRDNPLGIDWKIEKQTK